MQIIQKPLKMVEEMIGRSNFTRNKLFMDSFCKGFIPQLEQKLSQPLDGYTIMATSPNKQQNIHTYEVIIPKKYAGTSSVTEENAESVTAQQTTSTEHNIESLVDEFSNEFMDYFGKFDLEESADIHYGEIRETRVTHDVAYDEDNEEIYIYITVFYGVKYYMPYPIKTPGAGYYKEIHKLHGAWELIRADYDHLYGKFKRARERLGSIRNEMQEPHTDRLKRKVRELYADKVREGHVEDCNVCLEGITPEKLHVSNCAHLICMSCASRCKKCPICREEY